MSKIQSSAEHLTLNADGSSKDIKFQANGVEKASISSSGAFTSTTIDATKLTGTIPNFTSTGIDDNADATAITIDSSENVGIGTTSPARTLHVNSADANIASFEGHQGEGLVISSGTNGQVDIIGYDDGASAYNDLVLRADGSGLTLKTDGRGLSQFTAKAWVNFNGSGTLAIRDSHNVSSVTDNGTGQYTVNFANAMANANYCPTFAISSDNWGNGARSGNTMMIENGTPPTTSALRLTNAFGASSSLTAGYGNLQFACVTIFGD